MNAIMNSVYIFLLFVALFGFALMLGIFDSMYNEIVEVYEEQGIEIPAEWDAYNQMHYILRMGMEFLLVLSVILILLSSAIHTHSLQSYIISFLGCIIISAILIFLVGQLYNSFLYHDSIYINIAIIPTWFLDNLLYIFFLNVVAGLISFVFAMRGQGGLG